MASPSQHHPIPFAYRLALLYVEPLLALNGAAMLLFAPITFLTSMTPRPDPSTSILSTLTSSSSCSYTDALSTVRILTDQLAIMQILFAFNVGVVLRYTRDPVVWRMLCVGGLISDVCHIAASLRELQRDGGALGVEGWRPEEWINFALLGGMAVVRLGLVLGVGFAGGKGAEKKTQNGTVPAAVDQKSKS